MQSGLPLVGLPRQPVGRNRLPDSVDQRGRVPELGLAELGAHGIGPRLLGDRNRTQGFLTTRCRSQQSRSSVVRVRLIHRQAIALEEIRDARDRLAGDAPPPGDLGDRRWLLPDGIEDDPTGRCLVGGLGQGLPRRGEDAAQPGHSEDKLGERLACRRPIGPYRLIDNMMSFSGRSGGGRSRLGSLRRARRGRRMNRPAGGPRDGRTALDRRARSVRRWERRTEATPARGSGSARTGRRPLIGVSPARDGIGQGTRAAPHTICG
jgi:hypothetical protein